MRKISKLALNLVLCLSLEHALGQKDNVGIGTKMPDQSAVLDINSSSKGLLIPRMTLQQRNLIQSPAKGLLVYQTDLLSGFYFYNGKDWKELAGDKSVAGVDGDWTLSGNVAGASDFLGTTNNQPLRLKVNNTFAGSIGGSNGATLYGYATGPRIDAAATGNTAFGYATLGGEVLTTVSGLNNNAFGYNALSKITTGNSNVAVGSLALRNLTTGSSNFALGVSALNSLTTGTGNVAIGYASLTNANSVISNSNIGIGAYSLQNTQGGANIAIGVSAGELKNGSGNIYIGHNAGRAASLTAEENSLYIANSNTANPLIKGEFTNKNLKINLGATKSTTVGFLAVGNFDALFAMPTNNAYRLIVQDGIITEKVKVALKGTSDWADYVFEPSYNLMPLSKVESFIKENKHLPNVPSAEDMSKNGLDVTQTSAKLMEKIEELTLYIIDINKQLQELKKENEQLKKNIK